MFGKPVLVPLEGISLLWIQSSLFRLYFFFFFDCTTPLQVEGQSLNRLTTRSVPGFFFLSIFKLDFPVAQSVKNLPAVQKTWVWSLGWEDILEKEMTTHSSILAWKISWTEELGPQELGRTERWHLLKLKDIEVKVVEVWDSATPWTVPRQASLSMEFSRQEYWSGLPSPSPGDLNVW